MEVFLLFTYLYYPVVHKNNLRNRPDRNVTSLGVRVASPQYSVYNPDNNTLATYFSTSIMLQLSIILYPLIPPTASPGVRN